MHQKSATGVRCKWWKLGLDAVVVDVDAPQGLSQGRLRNK